MEIPPYDDDSIIAAENELLSLVHELLYDWHKARCDEFPDIWPDIITTVLASVAGANLVHIKNNHELYITQMADDILDSWIEMKGYLGGRESLYSGWDEAYPSRLTH